MSNQGGTLSLLDAVVEQEIQCKIPGCKNTWTLDSKEIVSKWKNKDYQVPKRMCDDCKKLFDTLTPIEVSCSTKDCDEKITISPYQQLIILKKKKSLKKEIFFCKECQKLVKEIEDKEIPCRVKGCENTWKWFASSQLREGGKKLDAKPEPRLCNSCFKKLQSLTPQKRPCKINNCDNEWTLDRMTQLEIMTRNKKEPKRMCFECNNRLKELTPKSMPCKVDGCNNTWEWSPFSQLEYERGKEKDPSYPYPERYCDSCFQQLRKLHPIKIPCSTSFCNNTIDYSVDFQLEDFVKKQKPEQRGLICELCKETLDNLEDKEHPCHQEGCKNKWTWKKQDQFDSGQYQNSKFIVTEPPSKYCERCHDFLINGSDTYVECAKCCTPILWTVRQQLMAELKLWVKPKLCPNCLRNS